MTKKQAGFSFAELLIVSGIIILFSTFSFVAYRHGQYRYELNNAAEKVASDARRAQSLAKSGKVSNSNQPATHRYGLAFVNETEYYLFRDLDDNDLFEQANDETIEKITLPAKIKFVEIIPTESVIITFPMAGDKSLVKIFRSTTEITDQTLTVRLRSEKLSQLKQVKFSKSGVVEVN